MELIRVIGQRGEKMAVIGVGRVPCAGETIWQSPTSKVRVTAVEHVPIARVQVDPTDLPGYQRPGYDYGSARATVQSPLQGWAMGTVVAVVTVEPVSVAAHP
jgi:hypothetical protein